MLTEEPGEFGEYRFALKLAEIPLMPALVALILVLLTPAAFAETQQDQQKTIVFGQSAALSGPARALGTGMRLGLLAAFEEVNRAGGVNGYALRLESLG